MKILPQVTGELATSGHCCGRAWPLPADATGAGRARSLLADALDELGVPGDTAFEATLMISELATNSHLHAAGPGGLELWLVPAGRTELACAVFDGLPCSTGPGECLDDNGRGLRIVNELSQGRWGSRRALSRLTPRPSPGKIVWFACTVPERAVGRLACCGTDPLELRSWAYGRSPRSGLLDRRSDVVDQRQQ